MADQQRQLVYSRPGLRDLRDLPKDVQRRVVDALERLATTGHGDVTKLSAMDPAYRMRVGTYRVLFDFEGSGIVVKAIRHRRESYR